MNLHAGLDFAGIAIGAVYSTIPLFWLVVHPFVRRWRAVGRRAYFALLPLWGLFALGMFAAAWSLRHLHLYQSWLAWIPATLFLLLGFALYKAGQQEFERSKIIGLAELEPDLYRQELKTGGIRSKVRHPLYLAHFCELFGWTLGTGSLALIAMLFFAMITGAIMIRKEDDELEQRFGEAFRRYRERVPAFLPR